MFAFAAGDALVSRLVGERFSQIVSSFLPHVSYFFMRHLIRTGGVGHPKIILWSVFGMSVMLTAMGCQVTASVWGMDA